MQKSPDFWQQKTLGQMNPAEWEALCDNCARCCLHKLEDPGTQRVHYTDVACALLDRRSCRCTDYGNRKRRVPGCIQVDADRPEIFQWLPDTCAYRLIFEGKPLFDWHHLVSGDPESVHRAGISVRDSCVDETYIHPDEIETRRIDWIECSPVPEKD